MQAIGARPTRDARTGASTIQPCEARDSQISRQMRQPHEPDTSSCPLDVSVLPARCSQPTTEWSFAA